MATEVIMPKFGMAQEEGQVIRWFIQEGESIQEGEPLLEVMTDKVSMEVEAPASGVLRAIRAKAEDVVPVAKIIAYIVAPGEDWSPPEEPETEAQMAAATTASKPTETLETPAPVLATPVAQRIARERGIDLARIDGSGLQGRITREDVEAQAVGLTSISTTIPEAAGKVRATPSARRIAREQGVSLSLLQGSGPRGRIQAADVEDFLTSPAFIRAAHLQEEQIIPLTGMRRIIAERMAQSARTAPHITFSLHADVTQLEVLRKHANQRLAETGGPKVSLTAILVQIVAWALRHHPWMNASLEEDGIHLKPQINIGLATALDQGLIVPVIPEADRKTLPLIATEINDLTTRARAGRLTPDEVVGGTFTISNLGMFGIETFSAILNPSETGILAVGMVVREPVAIENDVIVVRPRMSLTLSADHRVVDGVMAARFLAEVKTVIEAPSLMLL